MLGQVGYNYSISNTPDNDLFPSSSLYLPHDGIIYELWNWKKFAESYILHIDKDKLQHYSYNHSNLLKLTSTFFT